METKEKKKIGLLGALLMGIGCIVGSGIFGTLPTVIAEYGSGVIWALLGAAFVVVLRCLSMMYTSAAIPSSAAQFMWATKLIHPYAGVYVSLSSILMPTMVSLRYTVCHVFYPAFSGSEHQRYSGSGGVAGSICCHRMVWK